MIRTHTISHQEACLGAVSALDRLVEELVEARRRKRQKVSSTFLDWVADEATPLVEQHVARSFHTPLFAASLRRSDHRLALTQWVRMWICPGIATRFHELAAHLPEFTGQAQPAQPASDPAGAPSGSRSRRKPGRAVGLVRPA